MQGMLAGPWKRTAALVLFGMLSGYPALAQKGKTPVKPEAAAPAAAASAEPENAGPREAVEQNRTPAAAPAAASAAPEEAAAAAPAAPWADSGMSLLRTAGSVGLVICLILGGFLLFRRYAPQILNKPPAERTLRLIETLAMGEKRSIALVQAGGRKLLLASTPGQITLLTSFADLATGNPDQAGEAREAEAPATPAGSFRSLLDLEKKRPVVARPAARTALPPDIRGKMQELRKALEG